MTPSQHKIVYPSGAGYPFSNAIRAGDFVYVSGQIAFLPDGTLSVGSIETQTKIVLDIIQSILAEAGCIMADVIKCGCTLEDARDFDAFNKTYGSYFPTNPPVRTTGVGELVLDARVEIDCIAYNPLK
jgi:2-iminobutanoate/2-iminopropanoate deaminase